MALGSETLDRITRDLARIIHPIAAPLAPQFCCSLLVLDDDGAFRVDGCGIPQNTTRVIGALHRAALFPPNAVVSVNDLQNNLTHPIDRLAFTICEAILPTLIEHYMVPRVLLVLYPTSVAQFDSEVRLVRATERVDRVDIVGVLVRAATCLDVGLRDRDKLAAEQRARLTGQIVQTTEIPIVLGHGGNASGAQS